LAARWRADPSAVRFRRAAPRIGATPMSSAERQARRRARLRQQRPASPAAPTQRLLHGRHAGPPRSPPWSACKGNTVRGWILCRQLSKARRWPTSYRSSSNSTSRSWRQSIHHVVTAATDRCALDTQSPIPAWPKSLGALNNRRQRNTLEPHYGRSAQATGTSPHAP